MTEWNQILREEWYSQEKPDDLTIDFAVLLRKSRKLRVLDLGCGAGRNLIYMASQGFEAHGMDISETGLNFTRERLRNRGLDACIVKGDMNLLPYSDACFDAIVCLFTVYHQRLMEIKETISEIRRILRKKGTLLVNFHSKRSHKFGEGVEIEKDTFLQQEGSEKHVIHHFTDKKEITRLFRNFGTVNVKLRERKSADGYLQSHWIITASV